MAKKAKKRGVKPGTKRGPYRKSKIGILSLSQAKAAGWRVLPEQSTDIVGNLPSLMTELQATISQLEGQLTAQIDRIKSILM